MPTKDKIQLSDDILHLIQRGKNAVYRYPGLQWQRTVFISATTKPFPQDPEADTIQQLQASLEEAGFIVLNPVELRGQEANPHQVWDNLRSQIHQSDYFICLADANPGYHTGEKTPKVRLLLDSEGDSVSFSPESICQWEFSVAANSSQSVGNPRIYIYQAAATQENQVTRPGTHQLEPASDQALNSQKKFLRVLGSLSSFTTGTWKESLSADALKKILDQEDLTNDGRLFGRDERLERRWIDFHDDFRLKPWDVLVACDAIQDVPEAENLAEYIDGPHYRKTTFQLPQNAGTAAIHPDSVVASLGRLYGDWAHATHDVEEHLIKIQNFLEILAEVPFSGAESEPFASQKDCEDWLEKYLKHLKEIGNEISEGLRKLREIHSATLHVITSRDAVYASTINQIKGQIDDSLEKVRRFEKLDENWNKETELSLIRDYLSWLGSRQKTKGAKEGELAKEIQREALEDTRKLYQGLVSDLISGKFIVGNLIPQIAGFGIWHRLLNACDAVVMLLSNPNPLAETTESLVLASPGGAPPHENEALSKSPDPEKLISPIVHSWLLRQTLLRFFPSNNPLSQGSIVVSARGLEGRIQLRQNDLTHRLTRMENQPPDSPKGHTVYKQEQTLLQEWAEQLQDIRTFASKPRGDNPTRFPLRVVATASRRFMCSKALSLLLMLRQSQEKKATQIMHEDMVAARTADDERMKALIAVLSNEAGSAREHERSSRRLMCGSLVQAISGAAAILFALILAAIAMLGAINPEWLKIPLIGIPLAIGCFLVARAVASRPSMENAPANPNTLP